MAALGAIGYAPVLSDYILGPQIRGVVLDSAGDPAARLVRAYVRSTGAFVRETQSLGGTGAYVIQCGLNTTSIEMQVVCLDDDAGTLENDQILRTYPV